EARVGALERGGLRVGDVAGDVLQRVGLRLQAGDRGGERVENTHDKVSSRGRRDGARGVRVVAAVSSGRPRKPPPSAVPPYFQWVIRAPPAAGREPAGADLPSDGKNCRVYPAGRKWAAAIRMRWRPSNSS